MANPTYTSETPPGEDRGGSGTTWFKPSTHQFYTWSGGGWVLTQDGLNTVEIDDLLITNSIESDGQEGITGEYEGTFKKVKVVNGIIVEFEVE